MWGRHTFHVPVGVVDVGSNTVRLLVSEGGRTVLSKRETLCLGADIEQHGRIPEEKLEQTAAVAASFVAAARAVGATAVEILLASPGRQAANGAELAERVERAAECPTRTLSAFEEGHLAFLGAVSCERPPAGRTVAVVDVGGGSAQIVVGSRKRGPEWVRSIDLGSQRLTSRLLGGDPPGAAAMRAARDEVEGYLEGVEAPRVNTALAVGGSARALKRLVGGRLGPAELEEAIKLLTSTPSVTVARAHGIDEGRARTLPAGAAILGGIQRLFGKPLKVQRGGLREGALLGLADENAMAA